MSKIVKMQVLDLRQGALFTAASREPAVAAIDNAGLG
jgi:hypothetical protein